MAASSVFQRSSWKSDQLTPTVMAWASANTADADEATATAAAIRIFFM